jgi:hypothetical protein
MHLEEESPKTISMPDPMGMATKANPKAHPARLVKALGNCTPAQKASELTALKGMTYGANHYVFLAGGQPLAQDVVAKSLLPLDTIEKTSLWMLLTQHAMAWFADSTGQMVHESDPTYAKTICFGCTEHEYRADAAGFEMFVLGNKILDAAGCHRKIGYFRTVVRIANTGKTTAIAETHIGTVVPFCVGRAPEGYVPRADYDAASYYARLAHDEAASVVAFRRLARELAAHHAPAELIERAERAAGDEERHASIMSALAGIATPVMAELPSIRSLEAIATENAIEGCVRETYAALIASYQAENALDPGIRRIMRALADDETEHAELAHDVDAWLGCTRLDDALAELRRDVAVEPPCYRRVAGEPPAAVAVAMVEALGNALFEKKRGSLVDRGHPRSTC